MAGKKIPSMEDAVATFKDVMKRASLEQFKFSNRVLISKTPKNQSVLIIPELGLWEKLTLDKDFMMFVSEVGIDDPDKDLLLYGDKIDEEWISIDPEVIMTGSTLKITVESFMYELMINKSLIPLRLKKNETNNISYKLFSYPDILAVKKKFESPVEGGSFTIMRLLQIL